MYIQGTKTTLILNFTKLHQQIALTLLSGIGSKRARILINHFNDLDQFFSEKRLNIAKIKGFSLQNISFELRTQALIEADKIAESIWKIGGSTVFITDENYPRRLKTCDDAPLLLYYKGNIDWNPEKTIAVVGTRHATDYGKMLTHELIENLGPHQPTIVSGMAYGIDILAHRFALKNKLPTWGVLGHGIDMIYPTIHKKTSDLMLDQGGLISEFYPGVQPKPDHFPMRNRIVAGLADATIVVESGASGGSLITAQLANDYNRDVFSFPGDVSRPYSKGCLKLIQENKAHLVTCAADIIKILSWEESNKKPSIQRQLFQDVSPKEAKIIAVLTEKKELTADSLSFLMELSMSEIASELLQLEFKGLIRSMPGRRYALIP